MQNIDPVLFIQPLIVIAISLGLVIYWRIKRRFTIWILLYSLAAYAIAILAKTIFQAFTYSQLINAFGLVSPITGLYFGLQTVFLEVGLAYFFAVYAVGQKKFTGGDASGYGIGLAFWENGIYLGVLSLVSLAAIYAVLASGLPAAQQLYNTLLTSAPQYFDSPAQLLPSICWGILERISSILGHFSWGYLCVFAAVFRRRLYFLVALPMGMIDFFVVYAGVLGIAAFELLIFALSVASFVLALLITRKDRNSQKGIAGSATPPASSPQNSP